MEEIIIFIMFMTLLAWVLLRKTDEDKENEEEEKRLEKSMEDEHIYNPITGTKMTLEQAESGHFIQHDNEFYTIPDKDLHKYFSIKEKELAYILNYLKGERGYSFNTFEKQELHVLNSCQTLSSYKRWNFKYAFSSTKHPITIIPIEVVKEYFSKRRVYEESFSQIFIIIQLKFETGHYYLREKTTAEKLSDLIRTDDELKSKRYECFTIQKSENTILLMNILKKIDTYSGLEIEFIDNKLLLKSDKNMTFDETIKLIELSEKIFI